MKRSLPAELWRANEQLSRELLAMVQSHPIVSHPIASALEGGQLDLATIRYTHLEFRHAFAQIFTDALIQTMFTSAQLEPKQGALGKVSARCLIQLNVFDELGFEPGREPGEYGGTPMNSHYVQFDKTLQELGLSPAQVREHVPSDAAVACRRTLEGAYGDHAMLSLALALSESVFTKFAGPWAKNVKKSTTVDTSVGYHAIHVEHDGDFIDDDHAEDMWYVFRQAIEPSQYDRARARAREVLDTWTAFLDHLAKGQS